MDALTGLLLACVVSLLAAAAWLRLLRGYARTLVRITMAMCARARARARRGVPPRDLLRGHRSRAARTLRDARRLSGVVVAYAPRRRAPRRLGRPRARASRRVACVVRM